MLYIGVVSLCAVDWQPAMAMDQKKIKIVTILLVSVSEAQKPKTFQIKTFFAQKKSGQSTQNRFSRQT